MGPYMKLQPALDAALPYSNYIVIGEMIHAAGAKRFYIFRNVETLFHVVKERYKAYMNKKDSRNYLFEVVLPERKVALYIDMDFEITDISCSIGEFIDVQITKLKSYLHSKFNTSYETFVGNSSTNLKGSFHIHVPGLVRNNVSEIRDIVTDFLTNLPEAEAKCYDLRPYSFHQQFRLIYNRKFTLTGPTKPVLLPYPNMNVNIDIFKSYLIQRYD